MNLTSWKRNSELSTDWREIGLSVTLVPAIERGVNEHEVGKIIDFAIKHPAVSGINFQPAFHAGRHTKHDPMTRMTIPDVLRLIESQTSGKFLVSDFVPVPCCFPTCNSVTYAFIDGEKVTPLPRIVNVYDYLDYISNRVMPDFSLEIKGALEGLWSSSSVAGSPKSADQLALSCQACGLPESLTIGDIAQHMIMIMLQDFMDPWTFNQKNLMKCCKEFLLPGGKQIPFCAYNTVGYREQARVQLEAMEPERLRARKAGEAFVPRPITFQFGEAAKASGSIVGKCASATHIATLNNGFGTYSRRRANCKAVLRSALRERSRQILARRFISSWWTQSNQTSG